jgi:hypothetical protein
MKEVCLTDDFILKIENDNHRKDSLTTNQNSKVPKKRLDIIE